MFSKIEYDGGNIYLVGLKTLPSKHLPIQSQQ